MTNGSILLVEDASLFSPISQLNYEFYSNANILQTSLRSHKDIQCIISRNNIPFGQAQGPSVNDYADGIDTLAFLTSIVKLQYHFFINVNKFALDKYEELSKRFVKLI